MSSVDPWDAQTSNPHTVFVVSPIGEEQSEVRRSADQVLRHIIRKALPASRYRVERADDDKHPGAITPRIISKIIEADVIIADLSGANPNVFYELAVAHGYMRPVVHMQRADEKVAFDVKDMRIVRYLLTDPDRLEAAVNDLRTQVQLAMNSSSVIETPLTAAGKFKALDTSVDPQAEVAERLAKIETALESRSTAQVHLSPIRVSSDTYAAATWIEDQLSNRSYTADEIQALINENTSRWFDSWVRNLIAQYATDQDRPTAAGRNTDPWTSANGDELPPF